MYLQIQVIHDEERVAEKLIPFKPDHLELIELRDQEREQLDSGGLDGVFEYRANDGIAWTLIIDGRVIACFGITEMGGVADIWMMSSIYVKEYGRRVSVMTRSILNNYIEDTEPRRVQTTCMNNAVDIRFMEWMGLEQEGVLRKSGSSGEDLVMMSRID